MQDDLVMNKLPLPQYFDGEEWNTEIKPTRKCIPKYLHNELPALRHLYIKQKFKEIGKFNCPKLEYFDKMIKHRRTVSKPEKKVKLSKGKKQTTYSQLKEQLQYALIIADSDSNVVDKLLEKARLCKKDSNDEIAKRNKKRRLSLARETNKFFSNTVDLVFRQRRKQLQEQLKIKEEPSTISVDERINKIKLLPFQN